MSGRRLFLHLLLKAAWVRKDRTLTALVSGAVVATIATAALTLYSDLENKLNREFRSFGANVVVTKRNGALNEKELAAIPRILAEKDTLFAGKVLVVPVAYAIATTSGGSRVVVGGTDIGAFRELNAWWSVHDAGDPSSQVLLGARAAKALSPRGDAFAVSFGSREAILKPQIIFNSGSDDDSRIYIKLSEFTALTGVEPGTALMRVEGGARDVENAIVTLRASFPDVEVKPVRQITQAQAAVVSRTNALVLTASAVVLVLIMLCMIATLTSSVLERRKDFAVMKALGAPNRLVSLLFAGESSLIALAGAAAGFILGSGIAYWIGKANFDAAILPQPLLIAPVLLGTVLMALLAAATPLRLLQHIQPAGILRGE